MACESRLAAVDGASAGWPCTGDPADLFMVMAATVGGRVVPVVAPCVGQREGLSHLPRDHAHLTLSEVWRVGRKLGRSLYVDERYVGMMESRELAERVVRAMNGGGR